MVKLSPSILAANFSELGKDIKTLETAGADMLHIDVMDGNFVPNISFGFPIIQSIRNLSELPFDVHLMIEEPLRYVEDFAGAGADIIVVHAEACRHLNRTLKRIRECGKVAGVALNPSTPLCELSYILDDIDVIHVMTVNPGFSFQKLIPSTVRKIRDAKKMINDFGKDIKIEIDGGVTLGNLKELINAGVDIVVAGAMIFNGDIISNVKAFKEVAESCC